MTIIDLLRRTAARHATASALAFESRNFSYADMEGASNAAARVLRSHGVKQGDRVAICAEGSLEWVLAYLGALKLGALAVPLNPAYREQELTWMLGDAGPKAIVADRPRLAACAQAAPATVEALIEITRGEGASPNRRTFPFYEALRKAAVTPVDEFVRDRDEALIIYTSGTTGRAKGAVLTHGNLAANAQALARVFAWTDEDRFLLALPLFHVHGLCVGLHGSLISGGELRLLARFDADLVLDTFRTQRTTLFMGVPTMYGRLLAAAARRQPAPTFPALRRCVSGSAPLPIDLAEQIRTTFHVELLERYGMSETLITLARAAGDPPRVGTVGKPVPGITARVVDEHGNDVADGVAGELWVKGDSIGPRYWNNDNASAEARHDGWFKTGDVVIRDPDDGEFTIVGRQRDLIISGGYNVYPREVEEALLAHPAVAEAMVYGRPDADLGEAVVADVVLHPAASASATELIDGVKARLASYKKPADIRFVAELPRNAMGKVIRPVAIR